MTQTKDLIKKMADFIKDEYYEKGEDARLELSPDDVRCMYLLIQQRDKYKKDAATSVLDKIRAEIEAKCCITAGRENDAAITLHDVFEIINKYKVESEEQA